jgi:uncharacterized protein (DUF1778 family)
MKKEIKQMTTISIRVTKELRDELKRAADADKRPLSKQAKFYIEQGLLQRKKKKS